METKIIISHLRLTGRHGVAEQERRVGNEFVYDVELVYPFEQGAAADDLELTLNYAEAIAVIREVNSRPSLLLENVAWRLSRALTERFPAIKSGRVRVTKLTPPVSGADVAGVSAEIGW